MTCPLYQVLRARGVKFAFFHKVESLKLSSDKTTVAAVDMGVQATLKDPAADYDPLVVVKGLPAWPMGPRFEQLLQGQALQEQDIDLESYWSPWQPVEHKTLVAGQDYDQLVFAILIGAVPHLCGELVSALPAWAEMVNKVTTVQTQTMQLWLGRSTQALGWDIPLKNPTDTVIGATYLNPLDGQVDFSHLLAWESWPADAAPQSLWYFSGAMDDCETPPPFSDTGYPARAHARVKAQCIQYLQTAIGPLLPLATSNAVSPPGDPVGLDFSLLVPHQANSAGVGVQRFDQQFWRANIDPTERYVTSPRAARPRALRHGARGLVTWYWRATGFTLASTSAASRVRSWVGVSQPMPSAVYPRWPTSPAIQPQSPATAESINYSASRNQRLRYWFVRITSIVYACLMIFLSLKRSDRTGPGTQVDGSKPASTAPLSRQRRIA